MKQYTIRGFDDLLVNSTQFRKLKTREKKLLLFDRCNWYISSIINHNINGTEADYRFQEPSKYTRPVAFNLKSDYYLNGSRIEDPKYNDKNAPLQIHCFGDSWTYGWEPKFMGESR